MTVQRLYPLSFDPIFQYRLWGGRRLGPWMRRALPGDGSIGEAWLLSDRSDFPSVVSNGPLKGKSLPQLMARSKALIMGKLTDQFDRFPLLLKFLDVQDMLSVQVHPPDDGGDLIPPGETGKTEAWIVLEAVAGARIFAGLKKGVTREDLAHLTKTSAPDVLSSFSPGVGQAVVIPAGTAHSLGDGVMVFEVQENSDVTFRLFDWGHVDPVTGQPRDLQLQQALSCIDFDQGPVGPVPADILQTSPTRRERVLDTRFFHVTRVTGDRPFDIGELDVPRVLVCVQGRGRIDFDGDAYALRQGGVTLLSASLDVCRFEPEGVACLLDIAIPAAP